MTSRERPRPPDLVPAGAQRALEALAHVLFEDRVEEDDAHACGHGARLTHSLRARPSSWSRRCATIRSAARPSPYGLRASDILCQRSSSSSRSMMSAFTPVG